MSTLTTAVNGARLVARGPITREDGGIGFLLVHAVDLDGATLGVWTLPGRGWLVVAVPLIASARAGLLRERNR
jgi:hypothetical protein